MEEEIHWYFGLTPNEARTWIRINEDENSGCGKVGFLASDLSGHRHPIVFLVGRYWERGDFAELVRVLRERQAIVTQLGNSLVGCGL